jgi:hypothetical protein
MMLQRLRRRLRASSDRGLSLVELVAYIAVLSLVMLVLVAVFTSINNAQKTVTSVVGASNQGQFVANQIASVVKNSSAITLTAPVTGDQMLLTRTAKPGSTVSWVCDAWYYQSAANAPDGVGNLRFTSSSTAIAAPSASVLATWTSMATGITPVTGSTVFTSILALGTNATITFSFYATAAGQKPQLISTSATSPLGTTGSSPCF